MATVFIFRSGGLYKVSRRKQAEKTDQATEPLDAIQTETLCSADETLEEGQPLCAERLQKDADSTAKQRLSQ